MSGLAECRREAEVVAAVSSGRWPAAVDGALVEHVRTCAVCADVLACLVDPACLAGLGSSPASMTAWFNG